MGDGSIKGPVFTETHWISKSASCVSAPHPWTLNTPSPATAKNYGLPIIGSLQHRSILTRPSRGQTISRPRLPVIWREPMHMILQPEGWAKPIGYANGIAATGRQIFVGGQIGWNAQCQFETDDFVEQVRQTLQNVVDVLAVAGARPGNIT